MVLLVNQHTVPVFIDVANAVAETGNRTVLFSGKIQTGAKPLSGKISCVKSVAYNRKNAWKRAVTWLAFGAHLFIYLCRFNKPLKILVVTNPPIAPVIVALIGAIRHVPFYILVYDLYPEAFVQAGFMRNRNLFFRLWQKMNAWMFSKAKGVITLSESMKNAISLYMPADTDKISVINNWADTSFVRPVPKSSNAFIQRNRLSDKIVVMYSGNMGLTHDLESLVKAAEILRENQQVIFLFIGDGGKRNLLEKQSRAKKLENVVFLPYQNEVDFPLAMAAADIGVVTLGKGAEGISVPSKTYVNLAAGLCVLAIAPEGSELSDIVITKKAGMVCEPGNPERVADVLKKLISDRALLDLYKKNALAASFQFTSENALQYVSLLELEKQ